MPVEEIETTETVEKTKTEKVWICDGCGLDNNYDDSIIYQFKNKKLSGDLYFCESCLGKEKQKPINDSISNFYDLDNPKTNSIFSLTIGVFVFVFGYMANGVVGIFVGFILLAVFGFVITILYEIFIE